MIPIKPLNKDNAHEYAEYIIKSMRVNILNNTPEVIGGVYDIMKNCGLTKYNRKCTCSSEITDLLIRYLSEKEYKNEFNALLNSNE